jgi:uncharacterized protein (TIGR00369 family)
MTIDPSTRDTLARVTAMFLQSPCIAHLGLDDVALTAAGEVTATMTLKPAHERMPGSNQFHGGPIAAFIDTVGDLAVAIAVGGGVPTFNLRVDYLKPAMGPHLVGVARVRRLGRSIAVADVDVMNADGALVAIGRAAYQPVAG